MLGRPFIRLFYLGRTVMLQVPSPINSTNLHVYAEATVRWLCSVNLLQDFSIREIVNKIRKFNI